MSGKLRLPLAIFITIFAIVAHTHVAQAQGTITVQVTEGSSQGPPISGVNVRLLMGEPPNTTEFNAVTDSNGTCSFAGISGMYDGRPLKRTHLHFRYARAEITAPRTLFFRNAIQGPSCNSSWTYWWRGRVAVVAELVVRGGRTSAPAR